MTPGVGRQVGAGNSEPGHVVGGQIDTTGPGVFGHVLPVLGQLQSGADGVGPALPLGGGHLEGGQHQPSDRVGGQPAVGDEVVEGGVAPDHLILPVGRDEVRERRRIGVDRPYGRGRPGDQRVQAGPLGVRERQASLGFRPVERRHPVTAIGVAELIDEPGEAVEGHQLRSGPAGQEARCHAEVLGPGAPHDFVLTRDIGGRDTAGSGRTEGGSRAGTGVRA